MISHADVTKDSVMLVPVHRDDGKTQQVTAITGRLVEQAGTQLADVTTGQGWNRQLHQQQREREGKQAIAERQQARQAVRLFGIAGVRPLAVWSRYVHKE